MANTPKKKTTSSAKSGGKGNAKRRSAPPPDYNVQARLIGGIVCLLLALCVLVTYFNVDAILLTFLANVLKGCFGYGYWMAAPALLYAGIVLVNHKGRPVKLRLACTLLLPVLVGMVLHLLLARGPYGFDLEQIKPMWKDGQSLLCGGVVSGSLAVGMEAAAQAKADGISVLGIGEMGIGNTTTSAAVLSVLLDVEVEAVTGRGGGLTDEGFDRKKQVLRRALQLHHPDRNDVLDVLHKVGGLDIAAMTGAFLGCAHEGIAAAVDGYISAAAALCAVHLCPAAGDYLFLSHQSYELGYAKAAQALGLTPCLALDMRLGEGSGCPLLFRIMEGACGVMRQMATFSEAAIADDYLAPIRAGDSFTVKGV